MAPSVCEAKLQAAYTPPHGRLESVIDRRSFVLQVSNITVTREGAEGIGIGATSRDTDVDSRAQKARPTVRDCHSTWGESIDWNPELIRPLHRTTVVGAVGLTCLIRILGKRHWPKLIEVRLTV